MNKQNPTLPAYATIPFNHCNLPASIIGGLTYNDHPVPLLLDGVSDIHKNLFIHLEKFEDFTLRQRIFYQYMDAHFQLSDLQQMGQSDKSRINRKKINYERIIFGWHMNADSYEGAVLKRWVESRFGLVPRYHRKPIRDSQDEAYQEYLYASAIGIYNTNAIESQLDVLFSYSQYELNRLHTSHITLYRGFNQLSEHEIIKKNGKFVTLLLNNINSFTANSETAEFFGDYLIKLEIPIYKIFCYNAILPKQINSEEEYIAIGGLYRAELI